MTDNATDDNYLQRLPVELIQNILTLLLESNNPEAFNGNYTNFLLTNKAMNKISSDLKRQCLVNVINVSLKNEQNRTNPELLLKTPLKEAYQKFKEAAFSTSLDIEANNHITVNSILRLIAQDHIFPIRNKEEISYIGWDIKKNIFIFAPPSKTLIDKINGSLIFAAMKNVLYLNNSQKNNDVITLLFEYSSNNLKIDVIEEACNSNNSTLKDKFLALITDSISLPNKLAKIATSHQRHIVVQFLLKNLLYAWTQKNKMKFPIQTAIELLLTYYENNKSELAVSADSITTLKKFLNKIYCDDFISPDSSAPFKNLIFASIIGDLDRIKSIISSNLFTNNKKETLQIVFNAAFKHTQYEVMAFFLKNHSDALNTGDIRSAIGSLFMAKYTNSEENPDRLNMLEFFLTRSSEFIAHPHPLPEWALGSAFTSAYNEKRTNILKILLEKEGVEKIGKFLYLNSDLLLELESKKELIDNEQAIYNLLNDLILSLKQNTIMTTPAWQTWQSKENNDRVTHTAPEGPKPKKQRNLKTKK